MKYFESDILNVPPTREAVTAGSLLVAEPGIGEEFKHTVITMLDHNEEGSMGLVLNEKSTYTLGDVVPAAYGPGKDVPLYFGGPVERDTLFYVHTLGRLIDKCVEYAPGLWVGGAMDQAIEYVSEGNPVEGHIRFMAGYSGWTKGQLQTELDAGAWAVAKAPDVVTLLTGSGDAYWYKIVRLLPAEYIRWLVQPSARICN